MSQRGHARGPQRCRPCSERTGLVVYRAGHKCPIQAVQALDMDIPPNHSWELSAISGLSTLDPETFGLTEMPFAALGGGVNFDPYNSGPLILNEVGFFTGQSDPLITDQFQLENPLVHPVYDMFTIDDNLFDGDNTVPPFMGVPMLGSSQLHQPSAPCSTDPPHSGPTSNSPPADHPTDVPPTTVAPVDDLLLPFDHSDTALPLVPPNVSSGKSYPKQKPGSKVFKFIQEPQKRMKTYSRLTRKIEKLTRQLYLETHAYGVVLFAGIDSVAQSRSKLFFTDNMGDESEGQSVLERCGEEVSGYIRRKWAQSYLKHNKRVQSYRAAASINGAHQSTS